MTDYRHNFIAGGNFFFTVNLAERSPMRSRAMGFARARRIPWVTDYFAR